MALLTMGHGETPIFFQKIESSDIGSAGTSLREQPLLREHLPQNLLSRIESRLIRMICELGFRLAIIVRNVWKAHWIAKSVGQFYQNSSNFWIVANYVSGMCTNTTAQEIFSDTASAFLFVQEAVYSTIHLSCARQQAEFIYITIFEDGTLRLGPEIWSNQKGLFSEYGKVTRIQSSRVAAHLQDLFYHGFEFGMHTCNMMDICAGDPHFKALAKVTPLETITKSSKVFFDYFDRERKLLDLLEKHLGIGFSIFSLKSIFDENKLVGIMHKFTEMIAGKNIPPQGT